MTGRVARSARQTRTRSRVSGGREQAQIDASGRGGLARGDLRDDRPAEPSGCEGCLRLGAADAGDADALAVRGIQPGVDGAPDRAAAVIEEELPAFEIARPDRLGGRRLAGGVMHTSRSRKKKRERRCRSRTGAVSRPRSMEPSKRPGIMSTVLPVVTLRSMPGWRSRRSAMTGGSRCVVAVAPVASTRGPESEALARAISSNARSISPKARALAAIRVSPSRVGRAVLPMRSRSFVPSCCSSRRT